MYDLRISLLPFYHIPGYLALTPICSYHCCSMSRHPEFGPRPLTGQFHINNLAFQDVFKPVEYLQMYGLHPATVNDPPIAKPIRPQTCFYSLGKS